MHILDNPIWNALITGNKQFSLGNEQAKYYQRELGAFAGLKNNEKSELDSLLDLTPLETPVVLFTPGEIEISSRWKTNIKRPLLQMVFEDDNVAIPDLSDLKSLANEHIDAMIDLTGRTKPGPFLSRTIEFGNYMGIFDHNRLVAMTGQRMQPDPYTEISAVCTDPQYAGKGYAAKLILDQIQKIKAASRIPFLHLFSDNMPAYNLYKKLGFQARKEMLVYVIEKQKD
ncbi:GNAT family N-acetyltransferase [Mucilaginibacter lacusdianchii]|uniref:GNAT family N-acetyltransferase n=1 Tax=Mucilaginibacter lacusdianchii TaxID=2684211 RepID=UPI00131D4A08|nr:GNAT family N-acetyltransferase [Mucilaginibacter sp. JXJ CY 39]